MLGMFTVFLEFELLRKFRCTRKMTSSRKLRILRILTDRANIKDFAKSLILNASIKQSGREH